MRDSLSEKAFIELIKAIDKIRDPARLPISEDQFLCRLYVRVQVDNAKEFKEEL